MCTRNHAQAAGIADQRVQTISDFGLPDDFALTVAVPGRVPSVEIALGPDQKKSGPNHILTDAERLSVDPVMRQVVDGQAIDRRAASISQMTRFETEMLVPQQALSALMALPGRWIDDVPRVKPIKKLILDLDSSVSETYGQPEGSTYNRYFRCERYHRIFCFNQDGDVQAALLRHGNVARNWTRLSCHDLDDNQVRRQLFVLA